MLVAVEERRTTDSPSPNTQVDDWHTLLLRQRELEDQGMAEGADRYRARLERAALSGVSSTTGAAHLLMQSALAGLENAIHSTIEPASGRRGKGKTLSGLKWWKLVGPDVAAYMTLKVVIDGTASGHPVSLHKLADSIAKLILDELKYRRFKREAPDLFRYKMESLKSSAVPQKARSLRETMAYARVDTSDLDLAPSARLLLGMQTINLLVESVDWLQAGHVTKGKKYGGKSTVLVMTPEAQAKLSARNDDLAFLTPLVGPMVVPPLPWSKGVRGGYRFGMRNKFPFVRQYSKTHERRLAAIDMPLVYEAVNRLQNTAWKVNTAVLELVEEIIDLGGGYVGLPCSKDDPLPPQPADVETDEAARKTWKTATRRIRNQNFARKAEAAGVDRILVVAQSLAEEAAIYFPHSLDFRGRVYPIASGLTPQGDDLSRALLTFAQGKPVTDEGARWLAIHGANTMGKTPDGDRVSGMTLDQRVEWVESNRDRIFEVADSPIDTAWWIGADKPLQFYAFAVEWAAYCRTREAGEEYVSSLPCHMDGTANGLQHFAALLRDEASAKAVNLLPDDQPQDIYQLVADAIVPRLAADAATDLLAALWLSLHQKTALVDRRFAKRPSMTFFYGSKKFGFTRQIEAFLKEREDYRDIKAHLIQGERSVFRPACSYMAAVIWDALATSCVAVFDTMAWMQAVARGITKGQKSIVWTVPGTGFPVYQRYFQKRKSSIVTVLAGRTIKVKCVQPTDRVDRQKAANGIAPNAVHSLDAAALMLTVVEAAKEGISLSTLHDSYGACASDCPALARILRESFIRLYSDHDVLGSLYDQLSKQWADPSECPLPPPQGSLDLQAVREAKFFFC